MEVTERIIQFYKYDEYIKQLMIDAAYNNTKLLDNDYAVEYSNKLYETYKEIVRSLKIIFDIANIHEASREYIDKYIFKRLDERITNAGDNIFLLENFYDHCLVGLNDNFIKEFDTLAATNMCGYALFRNIGTPLLKCHTINEVLHVIHSYLINNDMLLSSGEVIAEKSDDGRNEVKLLGKDTKLSRIIYNRIDNSIPSDCILIFSVDENKTLMMCRDLGHAASMEISVEKDGIYVNYFIPKICNLDMVNQLKGVKKLEPGSKIMAGTTGKFRSQPEDFISDLLELLHGIPTDMDMSHDLMYGVTR